MSVSVDDTSTTVTTRVTGKTQARRCIDVSKVSKPYQDKEGNDRFGKFKSLQHYMRITENKHGEVFAPPLESKRDIISAQMDKAFVEGLRFGGRLYLDCLVKDCTEKIEFSNSGSKVVLEFKQPRIDGSGKHFLVCQKVPFYGIVINKKTETLSISSMIFIAAYCCEMIIEDMFVGEKRTEEMRLVLQAIRFGLLFKYTDMSAMCFLLYSVGPLFLTITPDLIEKCFQTSERMTDNEIIILCLKYVVEFSNRKYLSLLMNPREEPVEDESVTVASVFGFEGEREQFMAEYRPFLNGSFLNLGTLGRSLSSLTNFKGSKRIVSKGSTNGSASSSSTPTMEYVSDYHI